MNCGGCKGGCEFFSRWAPTLSSRLVQLTHLAKRMIGAVEGDQSGVREYRHLNPLVVKCATNSHLSCKERSRRFEEVWVVWEETSCEPHTWRSFSSRSKLPEKAEDSWVGISEGYSRPTSLGRWDGFELDSGILRMMTGFFRSRLVYRKSSVSLSISQQWKAVNVNEKSERRDVEEIHSF